MIFTSKQDQFFYVTCQTLASPKHWLHAYFILHVSGSRVSLSSSWGVHQALVHVSRWLLKGLTPGVGDIYSEDLPLTSKYKICALFVLREWMLKKNKKTTIQQPWARCVPSLSAEWTL